MAELQPQSLGEPIRAFTAGRGTRVVTALCGVILMLAGIFLIVRDFSEGIYANSFGWIPLPIAFCVIGLAYFMGESKYVVCAGGVIKIRMGQAKGCRWEEMGEIIDMRVKQGMATSRKCVLVRKDGACMELPDFGITDFAAMIDLLRQQAASHGIAWKEEQPVG